eukprot:gnl/TRDRNA2_/TRDRNA2_69618_c0_seq1.p1 gnl/TRDRNA2_/TRDRNA2_69618_c0~~gnl/TRDRNA2_/TRDRNA2_69618_c0_seq1.p1  ORF type:complete len:266 (-),score=18.64 gnl/TRDRNA2_/TRDRNA2_69618_c0_seq1:542-1264(-)
MEHLAGAVRAVVPRCLAHRRRSEGSPARPAPGVRFHRAGSIESIHLIDNRLAPEVHLSEKEIGAVRYMQADVGSRKTHNLNLSRSCRRQSDPTLHGMPFTARPASGKPPTPVQIRSASAPTSPGSARGSSWHPPAVSTPNRGAASASDSERAQISHLQVPSSPVSLASTCRRGQLAEMLHSPRSTCSSPAPQNASPQCGLHSSCSPRSPCSGASIPYGAEQSKLSSQRKPRPVIPWVGGA